MYVGKLYSVAGIATIYVLKPYNIHKSHSDPKVLVGLVNIKITPLGVCSAKLVAFWPANKAQLQELKNQSSFPISCMFGTPLLCMHNVCEDRSIIFAKV